MDFNNNQLQQQNEEEGDKDNDNDYLPSKIHVELEYCSLSGVGTEEVEESLIATALDERVAARRAVGEHRVAHKGKRPAKRAQTSTSGVIKHRNYKSEKLKKEKNNSKGT